MEYAELIVEDYGERDRTFVNAEIFDLVYELFVKGMKWYEQASQTERRSLLDPRSLFILENGRMPEL